MNNTKGLSSHDLRVDVYKIVKRIFEAANTGKNNLELHEELTDSQIQKLRSFGYKVYDRFNKEEVPYYNISW